MSFPSKLLYVLLILCQVAGLQSLLREKFIFKVTVHTARASIKHHPRGSDIVKMPTSPFQTSQPHPLLTFLTPAFCCCFAFSVRFIQRVDIYVLVFACCPYSRGYRCRERRRIAGLLPASPQIPGSLQWPTGLGRDGCLLPTSTMVCAFCQGLLRKEGVERNLGQKTPPTSIPNKLHIKV